MTLTPKLSGFVSELRYEAACRLALASLHLADHWSSRRLAKALGFASVVIDPWGAAVQMASVCADATRHTMASEPGWQWVAYTEWGLISEPDAATGRLASAVLASRLISLLSSMVADPVDEHEAWADFHTAWELWLAQDDTTRVWTARLLFGAALTARTGAWQSNGYGLAFRRSEMTAPSGDDDWEGLFASTEAMPESARGLVPFLALPEDDDEDDDDEDEWED